MSICRFGDFSLSFFLMFLSIGRFCALLASKCWSFLSICRLVNLKSLKPAYTQKKQKIDREKSPNLHILKKNKTFDSETSPYLHILKKIKNKQTLCGTDWHRCISFWFFWVSARLVTFHYQNFVFLSICRFCALLASTCWFFWVYAGLVNFKSLKPAYTQKKSKILIVKCHQTCIYSKKSKESNISDSMWDWLA